MQQSASEVLDSAWASIYKVGSAAAWLTAVFLPIQIVVFIIWPPPGYQPSVSAVVGWYTLLQNNRLVGLLDLDLLIIVDMVLLGPILLALYVALRRVSESLMAIAMVLGLVAVAAYFAASPAFSMLALSDQYAAAAEGQRVMFVTAGQAVMAASQGTAFHIYYILGSIAPIILSIVMLRSTLFSKLAAYLGIAANVIALGLYVPGIGIYISVFSVVILEVWYILIARRLFQLGRADQRGAQ